MKKKLILMMFLSMFMFNMAFASIYFNDSFNRADSSNIGWKYDTGTTEFSIYNNKLLYNTTSGSSKQVGINFSASTKFNITYKVTYNGDSTDLLSHIVTKEDTGVYADSGNRAVYANNEGSSNRRLRAYSGGWSDFTNPYSDGTEFILTMEHDETGTQVRYFIDGTLELTKAYRGSPTAVEVLYLDASNPGGSTAYNITWDDVCVYDAPTVYADCFPSPGPTINSNLTNGTYFNSENISININTTQVSNISYILNDNDLILTDGLVSYYNAENTFDDRFGSNDGTNTGTTFSDSLNDYGEAFEFDGVDDNINIPSKTYPLENGETTISFWYKNNQLGKSEQNILDDGEFDSRINIRSNNKLYIESDTNNDDFGITVDNDGNWNFYTIVADSGTISVYSNNILKGTGSLSNNLTLTIIGGRGSKYLNGSMDEIRIYNRSLNDTEIELLYNESPYTNICGDCSTNNLSLNNLNEVQNNLTLFAFNENGSNRIHQNFNIDLTAPNISIIGNLSQPQFEVNFSTIFNVTDTFSGIASCTLNATYLENVTNASQYNRFINCTDTETFNAAGLYNGFLIATDNAGNIATLNINGTIEPFVNVNFFDENNTAVTNYNAQIIHPSNFTETFTNISNPLEVSPFFQGALDLGTYTIIFSKLGYNTTNITIEINVSSGGTEYNFSVPGARINLRVFDITDYTIINGSNTTIEIIGDSFSQIYITETGLLNITSLEMEDETYTVIISNPSYETSTTSFNYDNQEVITVDAYLTPLTVNGSLIADLIVRGVDDYQNPLRGFTVLQYVWDSSQSKYVQSNLKGTDYNGETSFKVFLNTKLYNFCIEYQGIQYCENDVSVNINTEEVVIEVPLSELDVVTGDSIYDINFSYSLTNSTIDLITYNVTSVTFNYNNPNQNVDQYCLKIYQIEKLQRTLVANQCDTSHTTGLSVNIIENTSNSYIAIATVQVGDSIREIDELILYADYELERELDLYGLVKILLLVIVAFIIGVAIHKKVHRIEIAHFGLPIVFFLFSLAFPSYVSPESFVLVLVVNVFAWSIVSKKDDLQKEKQFNTLNTIIVLYMIFIFGLFTALTEIDEKGMLDDYGEVILDNIEDDNSYFNQFTNSTINNLKTKRADTNTGAWDLLTGIFLKTLEFVDLFFAILSNLFNIATNISLIVGVKNTLLLSLVKVIDYMIVAGVIYLYFKEAFK